MDTKDLEIETEISLAYVGTQEACKLVTFSNQYFHRFMPYWLIALKIHIRRMKNMSEFKPFAERVSQLYIMHPRIKRIHKVFDSIRIHRKLGNGKNSPRNAFIIGGSGTGKTLLTKGYAEMHPGHTYVDSEENEYDIRPVVYMELPNPFTLQEFYQTIIDSLGAPRLPGKQTTGDLKKQAFKLIMDQGVEMLIMDEMNHILTSRHVKQEEAMDAIKYLGNITKISLVCVGTPEAGKLRKLSNQYFRRYVPVFINRFESCDKEFCDFLNEIEQQIAPPSPLFLGDISQGFPQLLFKLSRGLVGILTPIIQEAYSLLGLFDEDISNLMNVNLTVDLIIQAYDNIIGDLDQKELDEILLTQDEKSKKPEQVIA